MLEQISVITDLTWYLYQENVILLFFDPCHLQHNTIPARMWQIKGKNGTLMIKSNSGRKRINIIGAFDFKNMKPITYLTEETCNSERIVEFFEKIKPMYPNKEIVIVLDNAKYNKSWYTRKYAEYYGFNLYFLPPYAPNLNLIERLWKFAKKKLVHNEYYEKYETFKKAVKEFFETYEDYSEELKTLITWKFQKINAV